MPCNNDLARNFNKSLEHTLYYYHYYYYMLITSGEVLIESSSMSMSRNLPRLVATFGLLTDLEVISLRHYRAIKACHLSKKLACLSTRKLFPLLSSSFV